MSSGWRLRSVLTARCSNLIPHMGTRLTKKVLVHSPFVLRDCTLIRRTAGLPPVANLRELRERLSVCPAASVYHHFCETKLRPSFDDPEYPNDFAVWAAHALRDRALAERLSMINGYDYEDIERLRHDTLELVDERLHESQMIPWAPSGDHFEFIQAMTVVYDTGVRLQSITDLSAVLDEVTRGSIYFHFVEARRRPPLGIDDFTAWLSGWQSKPDALIREIGAIDIHMLTLQEIHQRLRTTVATYLSAGSVL